MADDGRGAAPDAPGHGGYPHADAHFQAGTAHAAERTPCQDYALAEAGPGLPFAVLSDGCSLSGRTDVGARVLALAARRVLREPAPARTLDAALADLRERLPVHLREAAAVLGLEPGDLDATLGAVRAEADGGARAFLFGDGVIAARTPAGVEATVVEFAGNLPGYPAYLLDPVRQAAFAAESEAAAARESRAACRITRYRIGADGEAAEAGRELRGAADGLLGVAAGWEPGPDAPDAVAVFSDGVFQVQGFGWSRVVAELMAIRSARHGAFAVRRMTRALSLFAHLGGRPADDISMAALAAAAQP